MLFADINKYPDCCGLERIDRWSVKSGPNKRALRDTIVHIVCGRLAIYFNNSSWASHGDILMYRDVICMILSGEGQCRKFVWKSIKTVLAVTLLWTVIFLHLITEISVPSVDSPSANRYCLQLIVSLFRWMSIMVHIWISRGLLSILKSEMCHNLIHKNYLW